MFDFEILVYADATKLRLLYHSLKFKYSTIEEVKEIAKQEYPNYYWEVRRLP